MSSQSKVRFAISRVFHSFDNIAPLSLHYSVNRIACGITGSCEKGKFTTFSVLAICSVIV